MNANDYKEKLLADDYATRCSKYVENIAQLERELGEAKERIRVLERDMRPMAEKLKVDDLMLPNYQRVIRERDDLRARLLRVEAEPEWAVEVERENKALSEALTKLMEVNEDLRRQHDELHIGATMTPEFVPFPKIPRWSREVVVTEKIDGTNASVTFLDDGTMLVGSRNRFITPEADNFGFARWCLANEPELRKLGPGTHYGEWYGAGIQRTYGLKEKRFALFNVSRWSDPAVRPACCEVVPVLWRGTMDGVGDALAEILEDLDFNGSRHVPGFVKPEGVIIFHTASGQLFKKLLENDAEPKSVAARVASQT